MFLLVKFSGFDEDVYLLGYFFVWLARCFLKQKYFADIENGNRVQGVKFIFFKIQQIPMLFFHRKLKRCAKSGYNPVTNVKLKNKLVLYSLVQFVVLLVKANSLFLIFRLIKIFVN